LSVLIPGVIIRNPDEYLNHCLKQDVHTGILPHTAKEIKHKVKALFKHKNLKYIAAWN